MPDQNYSKEMTAALRAGYDPEASEAKRDAQVAALAEEFGKTAASVRQKLVRMGVYVAKSYKTKTGEKPEKKEDIVQEIANIIGKPSDALTGLEKATKNCLKLIREAVRNAAEADEDSDEPEAA